MMHAGKLDHQISIVELTTAKDEWNYDVQTESEFASAWAMRIDKRPSEEVEAMAVEAITRTEWWIRYVDGVTRKMEVHFDGDVYEIKGIQTMGRKTWLVLTTEMREQV